MPFPSYRAGSYSGPPGTYSSAMKMYWPLSSSITSRRRTTLGCDSFFMIAISFRTARAPSSRPCPAYLRRSSLRLTHFSAHSSLVCEFKHSFTFPNAPRPRSLMTTYWFRYALPRASERRVAEFVCCTAASRSELRWLAPSSGVRGDAMALRPARGERPARGDAAGARARVRRRGHGTDASRAKGFLFSESP
jgi:hypothetical protein